MSDATEILSQIERGDPSAAEHLLPMVYDELRKLAAAKLAVVFAALSIGLGIAAWQAVQATDNWEKALHAEKEAVAARDLAQGQLELRLTAEQTLASVTEEAIRTHLALVKPTK